MRIVYVVMCKNVKSIVMSDHVFLKEADARRYIKKKNGKTAEKYYFIEKCLFN